VRDFFCARILHGGIKDRGSDPYTRRELSANQTSAALIIRIWVKSSNPSMPC
jgi:hypothetical protein